MAFARLKNEVCVLYFSQGIFTFAFIGKVLIFILNAVIVLKEEASPEDEKEFFQNYKMLLLKTILPIMVNDFPLLIIFIIHLRNFSPKKVVHTP